MAHIPIYSVYTYNLKLNYNLKLQRECSIWIFKSVLSNVYCEKRNWKGEALVMEKTQTINTACVNIYTVCTCMCVL